MKNLIVQLRLNGKLESIEEDNRDITIPRLLQDKIQLNVVTFINYYETNEFKPEDTKNSRTIYNDETVVYLNLDVQPDNETFFKDGFNILKYIADALDFRPARITNVYERQDGQFTTTFINISMGQVIDGKPTL